MSSTTSDQLGNEGSGATGTQKALIGILVLALLLVSTAFIVMQLLDLAGRDEPATPPAADARSGTVELARSERRVVVDFGGTVTETTEIGAAAARRTGVGKPLAARVAGTADGDTQFRVVLAEPAPRGGATITWNVTGLVGDPVDDRPEAGWSTEWVVVLALMMLSLLAALAAYVVAVRRRQAGTDGHVDVGPELASFLKVAALLMIAALALIAVMLATDEKSLTGLFALLGTIAGYLAGNRSETSGGPARGRGRPRTRGTPGGTGGAPGTAEDPDAAPGPERRREQPTPYETRSLL